MKKFIFVLSVLLGFSYFVYFFFTLDAFNYGSSSYDISNYKIDAEVLNNGDLLVKEIIVKDGTFNGFYRDIIYTNSNLKNDSGFEENSIYNSSGISVIKSSALLGRITDFSKFDDVEFQLVSDDPVGKSGLYRVSNITDGVNVKTYQKSNNEYASYYYEYIIEDAVVIHEDIAELYYTFIGDGFKDGVDNLSINLKLPNDNGPINVWAHGPLNGIIKKTNSGAYASIDNLSSGNTVDLRVTFPREIIGDSSTLDHSGLVASDGILEVENERSKVADDEKDSYNTKLFIFKIVGISYLVVVLIYWRYVYIKYDKEHKSSFYHKYNREFINDYDVEVVDYLVNKKVTNNAMSACLMNLIYKKKVSVKEIGKNEYEFILISPNGLNKCEKELVELLFYRVGVNNRFTNKDLKNYASSNDTYKSFLDDINSWKKLVVEEGKKFNFFVDYGCSRELGFLLITIGVIIMITGLRSFACLFLSKVLFVPIILFTIYVITYTKRSLRGNEDYVRWMAFKRFLNDFGKFDIKELPEIALWERYLVYATVFGIAHRVQKAINVKVVDYNNINVGNVYVSPFYFNTGVDRVISTSINSAISSANFTGSMNSSTGSGGGFSSGGGFGGGGGGGGSF